MTTERLRVLTDLRNQALADARKIIADAEAAGRKILDSEEEARYDRFIADWDRYDAEVKREVEAQKREAAESESRSLFAGQPDERREDQARGPSLEEWLLMAIRSKGEMHAEIDLVPQQLTELRPEVRAFLGQRPERRTDTPLTTTDASTTYSSYAVPTIVAPYIEELKYAYSAVLQAGVNPVTTEGINTMYIPKVSTNPTINLGTAENTAPTNSSYPVLGRTQLDGYRHDAFVVISEEDIASSAVDMMGFLNRVLAGALAAKIANSLAVGTGSSQPNGIFVAATTGKTAASATTFTGDEVIEAYQSVAAQYRPGLRAVISQAGESLLSRLKDLNDNYIWRSGMVAGNPDQIQGVPLYVDPQGPALTTGKKPLVFYNPSNFHVRWCMGGRLMLDVSTEAQFTQFNRVIRIAQWMDCDAGDAGGCKSLTLA